MLSIVLFLLHLGGYAYISREESSDSESLLPNHVSISDRISDGSLPSSSSIKKCSLIPSQHTADRSEIVQVNSVQLQENYNLLYWL